MPNIAAAFREEIVRLASKEIRKHSQGLKKTSAQSRKDIAELKRRVAKLQTQVAVLERQRSKEAMPNPLQANGAGLHFSAKSLRSQRKRLGFSAGDYGKLLGVSGQTIYGWEQGNIRPRASQLPAIASLRTVGKREALARLERLSERKSQGRK